MKWLRNLFKRKLDITIYTADIKGKIVFLKVNDESIPLEDVNEVGRMLVQNGALGVAIHYPTIDVEFLDLSGLKAFIAATEKKMGAKNANPNS